MIPKIKDGYITFEIPDIDYIIEKSDVIIVYLKSGKRWVCDIEAPVVRHDNTVRYKIATKD